MTFRPIRRSARSEKTDHRLIREYVQDLVRINNEVGVRDEVMNGQLWACIVLLI